MKEREKEMEADERDRQREKEEIAEIKRKLQEEGDPDLEEHIAKVCIYVHLLQIQWNTNVTL